MTSASGGRETGAAGGSGLGSSLKRRWAPDFRHLPRDARDTLFQLAVIAWTALPHASHLPPWCTVLTVVVLLWRATLALNSSPLPNRWLIAGALTLAVVATLVSEGTLMGRSAGVTMLVVLMALKTLELRARRDALVIFFLGFFLVLTHFLFSQSLVTALMMIGSVWGLLTALVLANMPAGRPPLRLAGAIAARSALLGAPVMVVLFVLFPRLDPLWGVPGDRSGRSGLSSSMHLGSVAELVEDDSIAMRIHFEGPPPPPQALYFRGPVLSDFDGAEWRMSPVTGTVFGAAARRQADLRLTGTAVRYEVLLEPLRLPVLPLLEATPDRPDSAPLLPGYTLVQRADLQWLSDKPITDRMRFSARAWTGFEFGPRDTANPQAALMLREMRRLPPGLNPRTIAWASALAGQARFAGADARTLADAVLAEIRSGGFGYTLSPGTYGRDAIDEFWLDRRLGFCEHFAASFAVVLRAMGVPARIVTGYQGADRDPVDGWTIVRQSHAHAWAEYWQEGVGWVRADPTAAVAPDRVDLSRKLQAPPGLVAGALRQMSPEMMLRLRNAWETVNSRWNQWVMGYSRIQQFDLLDQLGIHGADWFDLGLLLSGAVGVAGLLGALWSWWDRRQHDPWQRLLGQVRAALKTVGVEARPHDPPRRLAAQVRSRLGADGDGPARALDALDRLRYARGGPGLPDRRWWPAFRRCCAQLKARGMTAAATPETGA
jgi:hypothetical protein